MSVYCQFYDNKQNKISEVIVSNASISIPANAVAGLFYDNTYKLDGLKLTLNNLTANDFSFDFAKDYFLYVFPSGYSSILATSIRSSSFMSGVPELSQNDIEYLKNLSDNSAIDLSTIVTALNSITSALSALTNLTNLTNLSNLADLANIIIAIQNKDNQSNIVSKLDDIFISKNPSGSISRSVFKAFNNNSPQPDSVYRYGTLYYSLHRLMSCFTSLSSVPSESADVTYKNRCLLALLALTNNMDSNASVRGNSFLKSISERLNNIETKLEQNLPFTTIVENEIVETNVSQNCSYGSKIEQISFSE